MISINPAIALALAMGGCSTIHQATDAPPTPPDCPGASITLDHIDAELNCDLNPPQQLNSYISLDLDFQLLCDNAGGELIWIDPTANQALCNDLDY